MIWHFLDILFLVFHTSLILFNLFGWICRKTRTLNLLTLILTGCSWAILGFMVGTPGYCPLTDWHFEVLNKLGKTGLPNSYISYLYERITGIKINTSLADWLTLILYIVSLVMSIIMNFIGKNKPAQPYVCPAELSGSLDNRLRKSVMNPYKIIDPFIKDGMTIIDIGCGPGFFTIPMAERAGERGLVIAADLQQGMLEKVKKKIAGTALESRIRLHKCSDNEIGISDVCDFVLAFWMVHEVPDQSSFFAELKEHLKTGGKILIVEPRIHVPGKAFRKMLTALTVEGFELTDGPGVFFSRSVIAEKF